MQTTLSSEFSFSGTGVFTGRNVNVTVHPADQDNGIVFLKSNIEIPSQIGLVEEVPNRTKLVKNGETVQVVEHILSALHGMGVDNAIVEVDSIELPLMDASAKDYVRAIQHVGITELNVHVNEIEAINPVYIEEENIFIGIFPDSTPRITYHLDHEHPHIGTKTDSMILSVENFSKYIGPARTFITEAEAKILIDRKIVGIDDTSLAVVAGEDGLNQTLRHPLEMVHHKMLDIIGDLSLAFWPIRGHIMGIRSGHFANRKLARLIDEILQ